ncbi:transcriptional regulator [Mesorhizobium erdmanii]|uniref:Transcriptional regulator n=2 Tax=Mesorhizobium erdmanii TaxID=1777866 RepID=A0A6M7US24_9HYPH|nr:transcriptional regulator [Mesorhizobium erdmanii]
MFPSGIKPMPKTTTPVPTAAPPSAIEIARRAAGSVPRIAHVTEQGDLFGPLTPIAPAHGVSNDEDLEDTLTLNDAKPVAVSPPRRLPSAMSDGGDTAGQSTPQVSTGRQQTSTITSSADIGRLVREARKRGNFSQQKFADLAGVGRRFLSELENGKPTLELGKVLKVANAAGIVLFARKR